MKVVINADYGGYSLSPKALKYIADKASKPIYFFECASYSEGNTKYIPLSIEECEEKWLGVRAFNIPNPAEIPDLNKRYDDYNWSFTSFHDDRTNPLLIEVVEKLGKEASGSHATLKIVEIPDDIEWSIQEYDGCEWVAEKHRTWQ